MKKIFSLLITLMPLVSVHASDLPNSNWEATFHLVNGATIKREPNRIEYHYTDAQTSHHPEDCSFLKEILKVHTSQIVFEKDKDYGWGLLKHDVSLATSMSFDDLMQAINCIQKISRCEYLVQGTDAKPKVGYFYYVKNALQLIMWPGKTE